MIAHTDDRTPDLEVLQFNVEATRIVDLRDHEALKSVGIDPADAAADWQRAVAAGGTPPSWGVREALQSLGANGLIDPSRKQPQLWHLTLFNWNAPGAPSVGEVSRPVEDPQAGHPGFSESVPLTGSQTNAADPLGLRRGDLNSLVLTRLGEPT
jgi:RES domain-containing protein